MDLTSGAEEAINRKKAGLYALLDNWARQLETHAKEHAPWKDRTGHARQGLTGGVDVNNNSYILYLSHSMEYGKWLELAHGGNYAIVNPTVDQFFPTIKKSVQDFWE